MNALLLRARRLRSERLDAIAARPLARPGSVFATVADFIDAALGVLRGDESPREQQFLTAPPLPCVLVVTPHQKLSFQPVMQPSKIAWTLTSPKRPALDVPDWEPSLRKLGNNRWTELSPRLGRPVQNYSNLEQNDFALLEIDRTVARYCEQVNTGDIVVGDVTISARLDRWIQLTDGSARTRELKYLSGLVRTNRQYVHVVRQLAAELLFSLAHNATFEVVTDEWMRGLSILLENAKKLLPYGHRGGFSDQVASQLQLFIRSRGRASVEFASAALGIPPHQIRSAMFHLVFWGHLSTDSLMTERLTDRTEVHDAATSQVAECRYTG